MNHREITETRNNWGIIVKHATRKFTSSAFIAAALLLALFFAAGRNATAGTLSPTVIGMFPKEVGEFAYADLKTARQRPWFPQLREQLLPSNFRKFEQFLSSAGVDPNTQVDEMAWAAIAPTKTSAEQIVGIALGSFDPGTTEDRFKAQKMAMTEVRGYRLYAFGAGSGAGDIFFTFIDSNTAAFGQRSGLEKLLDVRTGVAENLLVNEKLAPLIKEANGNGTVWAVLDQGYTHIAMTQLIPQAGQFPQAQVIIDRMQAMTIDVEADSGIDTHFQAVCGSSDDANVLAAALQAGIMMRKYQESSSQPDLAGALDHVTVSPSGDRLRVDAPVTQDQLLSLIRSRAFATSL
jgi:hypothetical protein